jgi:hypothetical protein
MKKVALAGGAPLLLAGELEQGAGSGQWGPNDTIYFSNWPDIQLRKVAASGGTVGTVTHGPPPNGVFRVPVGLFPDGRRALVSVFGSGSSVHLDVVSLETGEHQLLLNDAWDARLMPEGHLLYLAGNHTEVLAVAFDMTTLKISGDPVVVLDSVAKHPDGIQGFFAVSSDGTLAYVPLSEWVELLKIMELVLVGRDGTPDSRPLPVGAGPRFSPDGGRLVYSSLDRRGSAISVADLAHGTEWRVGDDDRKAHYAWSIFSADGRRVVFNSDLGGTNRWLLYSTPADGSGKPTRLATDTIMHQQPFTWAADGRDLLYTEGPGPNGMDIWTVPVDGSGTARPLMQGPSNETQPAMSPDGKWLAWATDASGQLEVMVRRYPDGPDVPVSRDGGAEPAWGPGGRELYFRDLAGTEVMVAAFHPGERPVVDQPTVLFKGRYWRCWVWCRGYDVSPDGRRFVMQKTSDRFKQLGYWPSGSEIRIVPHWDRELERKLRESR